MIHYYTCQLLTKSSKPKILKRSRIFTQKSTNKLKKDGLNVSSFVFHSRSRMEDFIIVSHKKTSMYRLLLILICALSTSEAFAQVERFPFIWPNSMVNWKQENLDSSQHLGIGIGNEVTFGTKFPATYFGDSTGCLIFDVFCYNPSKGFSDDYVIRKSPY